VRNLHLDWAS